ncbi:hypothetical protein RI129_007796 [Pyrocoelia pectoralis]|uniref:Uncharacterized protein n=1 Tax=Pyrocoelia pectoralis TaxID=417401 RepID=A0AAN7VF51_9COLE
MIYILFTTRGSPEGDCLINISKTSNGESSWLLHECINTNGEIFSFNYKELNIKVESEYKEWMDNFYLFTKQITLNKIDVVIQSCIENLIRPVKLSKPVMDELYQKFILFLSQWSKGDLGGYYPLTKTIILKVIFECVIKPYIWNFEVNKPSDKVCDNSFSRISKSVITVIDNDSVVIQFLSNGLYRILEEYLDVKEHKVLWKRHPEIISKTILRATGRYKNITMEAAYEFLWKNNKLPLILSVHGIENYKFLLQLLKVFHGVFNVIILTEHVLDMGGDLNLCSSLKDFGEGDRIFILNYPVKLQNRQFVKLASFVQPDKYQLITVKDIIYILMDKFNIGDYPPPTPEIFIQQSLDAIWIKSKVLKEISGDRFIIHYNLLEDLKAFLSKAGISLEDNKVLIWQTNCTKIHEHQVIFVSDFGEISKIMNSCHTICAHVLMLQGRDGLEWVHTYGTHQNIAPYRKIRNFQDLSDHRTFSTIDTALKVIVPEIILISANPGMGKSTMLAYFANTAPTDRWILTVNLIDHLNYYKKNTDLNGHVHYFAKQTITNTLGEIVFDFHVQFKRVTLLFDGFDEVPVNMQKKVVRIICECKELGCAIYLTTRTNMQPFLEESLQTFGRSIIPFSNQEQFEYLRTYFSQNCKADSTTFELINNFTHNLLKAASDNLNDHDQKFTGVPLQTKLLCQVFKNDCDNYLRTKSFENKYFDLIYLYKHFIREKIDIVCEKFGKGSDDTFHHYKTYRTLYALQSIFPADDLESLNVDQKLNQVVQLFPDTLHHLQKDGIVTVRNKTEVRFIHRSFAEYLVAKWLSKNFGDEDNLEVVNLIKKIFDPNFVTVRNMFDRIMAKRNPLHLAVINRQINTIKTTLERDGSLLSTLDRGNRSVFHLVASWGVHHSSREMSDNELRILDEMISKDTMMDILNLLGKVECSRDSLLNYTPIDYAIASGSLNVGDALCAQLEIIDDCITLPEQDSFYMSTYFNLFPYGSLSFILRKHTITTKLYRLDQIACASEKRGHHIYHTSLKDDITDIRAQIATDHKFHIPDEYGFTPLHFAAFYGQSHIIQALMEENVNVNTSDKSGKTPLHWAAVKCHPDAVSVLLRNSADPNIRDINGMTVLHYLCMINIEKDDEIISMLLQNNADVEMKDYQGETALHYAFHYNRQKCVTQFLNRNTKIANISVTDSTGATILHWAANKGDEDIVKLLLDFEVQVDMGDNDGKTPLHCACQKGHLNVVHRLALHGADLNTVDKFGRSPLYIAVDSNKYGLVNFLLCKNAETTQKDIYGRTALYQAIAKNYEPIVSALLNTVKDCDTRDNENLSLMHWAAWSGHKEIVELLLSRKLNCTSQDKYDRIPLICAAQYGHTSALQSLLRESDVQAQDENNMNSLHWSCWNGHIDIVRILLLHMPNVELKDNKGRTALSCCCHNGHSNIVRLLLTRNADVNTADNNCMTPLNWAAHNGHYETVKLLLQRNCVLETMNHLGRTALSNASSKGYKKIVSLLLASSFPMEIRDSEGMTALHTAAVHGHLDIISILTENGANLEAVSNYKKTALIYAANYGQASIVNYLINQKVSLNAMDNENMTAVTWAAHDGHNDIVALLVGNGADVEVSNKHGRTPLLCAVHNNHYDVVKTLLFNEANVERTDNEGLYCIHQAAYNGNVAIYKLLEHKFPVDFKDNCNRTPLIHAAFNGHNELICMLLENGAYLDTQDSEGMSALHWACFNGHTNTMQILLSNCADSNSRDMDGNTPIVYAIVKQHEDIVSLLIEKTDLNLNNYQNVSPLHVAAGLGNRNIVDMLVSKGANIDVKNNNGVTPLMCASGNGRTAVVELLISKNAGTGHRDNNSLSARDWAKAYNQESVISLFDNI